MVHTVLLSVLSMGQQRCSCCMSSVRLLQYRLGAHCSLVCQAIQCILGKTHNQYYHLSTKELRDKVASI